MNKSLVWVAIVLTTASLGANVYFYLSRPHLGYVRSHDLVEKYLGTQEARTNFEKKKTVMMANVDSLKLMFEKERTAYINVAHTMTPQHRRTKEEALGQQQSQIIQYSAAVEEQIGREDEKMMEAVLTQINTFVDEYARERDFDIIMGTTLSGSLLYGRNSFDVTDDILEKLNAKYKGL